MTPREIKPDPKSVNTPASIPGISVSAAVLWESPDVVIRIDSATLVMLGRTPRRRPSTRRRR